MTGLDRAIQELARYNQPHRLHTKDNNPLVSFQQGLVVGVHFGGLDILLRGTSAPAEQVRYLRGYTPGWGDIVWVARFGSDMICLGDLETLPGTGGLLTEPTPIEDWHVVGAAGEPAFENSWAAFGSTFEVPRFAMQSDGWVRCEGLAAGGTTGTTMWTMPEAYRPPFQFRPNTMAQDLQALVNVNVTGGIQHQGAAATYVSLDSIVYPTADAWERDKDKAWFSIMRQLNGWRMNSILEGNYPQIFRRGDGWRYIKGMISAGTATADTFVPFSMQDADDASIGGEIFVGRQTAGSRWDVRGNSGLYGRVTGDSSDFTLTGANFFCTKGESILSVDPDYPHKSMQVWNDLTLINGWADYVNLAEQYRDAQYFVDAFGITHVRGVINGAAETSDVFATVPAGARPLKDHVYSAWKAGGGAGGIISRLTVRANGNLEATGTTTPGWYGFNGHWKAEQ